MRRRRSLVAALCASALFAAAPSARANGRFPAAGQLVVSPADPSHLVVRATYGILFSNDRGQTWDWLCEKAVGYGAQVEDPSFSITGNDSIVMSTFEGLAVSPDHGCGWSFVGGDLSGKLFNDVTIHADDPAHVLALVSKFAATTDAGITYTNLIDESHDNGATWSAVGGALDPSIIAETIDTAKGDPNRLYVSGIRGQGTNAVGVFLASTDGGKTFTESTIPLVSTDEHAPYIGAVDPTNPDRIYVRIAGSTAGRLLASSDGGKTFTPIFSGPPLFGFAVSPDGAKVFVGASNGLFEASSSDLTFTQRSSIQVQCLATSGTRLYACSVESSGFVVGASDDDGTTFTPLLHLDSLRGPLACPSGSSGSLCLPDWPATAANLGIGLDAGTLDAGSARATATSPSSGCSCDVPGGKDTGLGAAVTLVVAALASLLIRRKKKA